MPKVSVIVPVYKVEDYIARCVSSLFAQTLDDLEFIFIDDCTPDRSMDILGSLIDANSARIGEQGWKVLIEHMPENSGVAAVRERGIRLATGDYIIHCDSDDWVEPGMYGLMYGTAVRTGADMVVCDYAVNDGKDIVETVSGCRTADRDGFLRDLLLQRSSWALWNKLVARRCLTDDIVFPKGNIGEDMALTFQMLLHTGSIAHLPEVLYSYFLNRSSITNTRDDDTLMRYFSQRKDNADIVYDALRKNGLEDGFAEGTVAHKLFIKSRIRRTSFNREKRKIWRETYSEINGKVLSSPVIPFAEKLKFIGTYLGIYPYKK